MRRSIFLILFLHFFSFLFGQVTDQRLLSTKIVDVLATMPAQNELQLNKSMESISQLGEQGITQMVGMLSPPGTGDNTALEYAIGGYSYFVMQPGQEKNREAAIRAYCAGLEKIKGDQNKQFLLSQLQQIGNDHAVVCVEKYLNDAGLAGPAARALAQFNTPSAQKALLNSLSSNSSGIPLSIVEALGFAEYKSANSSIIALIKRVSKDEERKILFYALGRIGDPQSAKFFQDAVQKARYKFDNSGAVSAYILYLGQLAQNGNTTLANELARKLMQQALSSGQLSTRIAALNLVTEINGQKSVPILFSAMQDKNIDYRAAALGLARKFQSETTDQQWAKLLPKISPEAQVQVVSYLGRSGNKLVLPEIKKLITSKVEEVRIEAINAIAKIGQQESLPLLISLMRKGHAREIEAIRNSIFLMPGDSVTTIVARAIPGMPASGKVALLEILRNRSADHAINIVVEEINNRDTSIHKAAVKAFPAVVMQKDLPGIFSLLNRSQGEDVPYFQQAVINASSYITDTLSRTSLILQQLSKQPNEIQWRYYDVLATIGGKKALEFIANAFKVGNENAKLAAVKALSKAKGATAARQLLQIASAETAFKETAINGMISNIRKSGFPPVQKLLLLEAAMDINPNEKQKKAILSEAGNARTFLSLIFVGRYLYVPTLQLEAAYSAMNIALGDENLNGPIVKKILTKTIDVLKGPDADYQRKAIQKFISDMPSGDGFVALFNGRDLEGWKGLVGNPIERAKLNPDTLKRRQQEADKRMREGWSVKDGNLIFNGHGDNLCTQRQFGDFEMYVDWKITKDGDAGIYLRGTPQVQIWDTARRDAGAQVGSGGLYNNQKNPSVPLVVADNEIGEWNTFHIIMKGDKVTAHLNGQLVTDNVVLENYWDRSLPIFSKEQIELQAHGTYVAYRNVYLKELNRTESFSLSDEERKQGFKILFDGSNLDQWTGNKTDYKIENGNLVVEPKDGSHGNLFTKEEFSDFILRFEFQLTPGANNGLGIRAPLEGDAAYTGMELQILDNEAEVYKDLKPYQFHGSVYGVIPAKRGFLKPVGEWNYQEVIAKGSRIKVILNGEVILDGDIQEASKNGTMDHNEHPGLKRTSGHIGFLGHGSVVRFRNIRVRPV